MAEALEVLAGLKAFEGVRRSARLLERAPIPMQATNLLEPPNPKSGAKAQVANEEPHVVLIRIGFPVLTRPYSSKPTEPKPRVAPMMPDGENSHNVFIDETEEDRVWKPMNKAAPNGALHHRKLARMRENPVNCRIHLETQSIAQTLTEVVVARDGAV